jgi:TolA-binding protein
MRLASKVARLFLEKHSKIGEIFYQNGKIYQNAHKNYQNAHKNYQNAHKNTKMPIKLPKCQ